MAQNELNNRMKYTLKGLYTTTYFFIYLKSNRTKYGPFPHNKNLIINITRLVSITIL